MNIQWYPGHMTKSRRMMEENIALVDIVITLLDARIPYSSQNPDIDHMARNKKRITLLNKADLADPTVTAAWKKYFEAKGHTVILTDAATGKGLSEITAAAARMMREKVEAQKKRGRINVPTRAMIVGIPNVGKSTLINRFAGRAITKTGDKPGVTRGKQWVKIKADIELLDTPGILWPRFNDEAVGLRLAYTGAIKDDIMDIYTLSQKFIAEINRLYPTALAARYKITPEEGDTPLAILQKIGTARSFRVKNGAVDEGRAANMLMNEFRAGKLGKLSLEVPEVIDIIQMHS